MAFLDDLYIHPKDRGSGAVQILFKELKTIASENGWPYVRWITATDNHRARAVYDKISGNHRLCYLSNANKLVFYFRISIKSF